MVPGEFHSLLDVLRCSGVDTNHRHVPLLTRDAEGGVEIAALDRPVGKGIGLVVGVFGSTRLVRTPETVEPASDDITTISCSRVVARGGGWDGVDQWLRDSGCEGLELGIGRPTR